MSSTSSEVVLSSSVGKEKSVLWFNTYFFNFTPHTVSNMNDNVVCACPNIKPDYVEMEFDIQFIRVSELEFRVVCCQKNEIPIPGKYSLEFQCSINIFDQDPRVFQMQSYESKVFETFYLDASYRDSFTSSDLNKEIQLMISVKMIEYDCASNEVQFNHERDFHNMIKEYFDYESILQDLCYMLDDIPRLEDIFTGRQNSDFARLKSTYIRRAASFSKEIVGYMKCRGSCMPVPVIDLGLILGFIFKGERIQIKDTELLHLYFDAHRLGLNFLVDLIHDAILGRLENKKYFLKAMRAAHRVNDKILFYELSKHYQEFQNGLADHEGFIEMLGNINIDFYFMARALVRQMKRFESGGGVEASGSSNSNPRIIVSLK